MKYVKEMVIIFGITFSNSSLVSFNSSAIILSSIDSNTYMDNIIA